MHHPLSLEHGDVVVDDLGPAGANDFPPGAQAGDGHEIAAPEVCRQEGDHLCGRPGRCSCQLELQPGGAAGKLQLP